MSTKILVAEARARFNHAESKLYLREKYTNKLNISHAGGMWFINIELINFLRESSSGEATEILVDKFNNPIEVDRKEFLELATRIYNDNMAEWLREYNELSKKR